MPANIATSGLTANQHTGNGWDYLCMVECPDVHITFPSWCSTECLFSHVTQHVNYTQVQNFSNALQAGYNLAGWESICVETGISATPAKFYAQMFSSEEITWDSFHMVDCTTLKELGIETTGEVLTILKLTKELLVSPVNHMKPLNTKLPQFVSEMTTQQFRKFRIDWDIFTRMTNLPTAQTDVQLYNCADETIQNSIINTNPNFFNISSNKLLDMLEVLDTGKSNPMVHRISFSSIAQSDNETVQNYVVRLWSGALDWDCDFICPNCHHDLSHIYIKDQFIRGIANDALQVDMLAKAGSLKTLEENISHAEAFEMAMHDQNEISGVSDMAGLWMSAYCQQRRARRTEHVASKTTLRWSADRKAWRIEVLCNALGMRKPPWMPSLHT